MKKMFAVVFCVALLFTSFPISAFADNGSGNEVPEATYTENSGTEGSMTFKDQNTGIVVTTDSNAFDYGTKLVVESVENDEIYRLVGIDYIAYKIYFESENGEQINSDDLYTISIPVSGNKPKPDCVMQTNYIVNQRMSELTYRYENGILTFNDKIRGGAGIYVISSIPTNNGGFRNVLGENVEIVDRQLVWTVDSVIPKNIREASALMNVLVKDTEYYSVNISFDQENFNPYEASITIIPKIIEYDDKQTRCIKIKYNVPNQELINEANAVADRLITAGEIEGTQYCEYSLEDMSLINFYNNKGPTGDVINYINELRNITKNSDVEIKMDIRGAGTLWECEYLTSLASGRPVTTTNVGVPVIFNEGVPCCIPDKDMQVWHKNVIYVPENTDNPYEAAVARLTEYFRDAPGIWYEFDREGKVEDLNHEDVYDEGGSPHAFNSEGDLDESRLADDYYYRLTIGDVDYIFFLYRANAEELEMPKYYGYDSDTGVTITSSDGSIPLDAEFKVSEFDRNNDSRLEFEFNTSDFVAYNVEIRSEDNSYNGCSDWTMTIPIPEELKGNRAIDAYCLDYSYYPRDKSVVYTELEENRVTIKSGWASLGTQIVLVDPAYTDVFKKVTSDGTLEVDSIKPETPEALDTLISDTVNKIIDSDNYYASCIANRDEFNPESANIAIRSSDNSDYLQAHQVKIKYNEPDDNTIKEAKELGDKITSQNRYMLDDLSLLNYRIHSGKTFFNNRPSAETNAALQYVPEIRNIMGDSKLSVNFASPGIGDGDIFDMYITMNHPIVIYSGSVPCYVTRGYNDNLWFEARNVIYIPEDSQNPEKDARKRLDAYLGEGKYTLECAGDLASLKALRYDGEEASFIDWYGENNDIFDLEKIAGKKYYKLTLNATGKTYNYVLYEMPEEDLKIPEVDYTDEASGITVIGENATLPIDVALSVEKIDDVDISDQIGTGNYVAYDISLHSVTYGGEIKAIKNGTVTVKMPISESLQNKNIAVYHISDNGVETEYKDVKVKDGYAIFKADHFSTYVIAERIKGGEDKPSDPGETNPGGNTGGGGTVTPSITKSRVAGDDRFETAIKVADKLKSELGVVKFNNIVVANSDEFADALSATALAADKDAPILVVNKNNESIVKNYISANLNKGGNVYIIGGTAVVSESFEKSLTGCKVTRLGGSDRYETNLEVLKTLGATGASDIMVASGLKYPDALSASATGNPVLLVGKTLTDNQKAYLATLGGNDDYYVIGGTAAVNATVMNQLKASKLGTVTRLGGDTRYETGLAVAEEFFDNARTVVIASGDDFPDGLTGGVLANAMNAPLMLVNQYNTDVAADYVDDNSVRTVIAIGGTTVIPDVTLNKVA